MRITIKTGDGSSRIVQGFGIKGVPRTFTVTPEQADRLRANHIVVFVEDEKPEEEEE